MVRRSSVMKPSPKLVLNKNPNLASSLKSNSSMAAVLLRSLQTSTRPGLSGNLFLHPRFMASRPRSYQSLNILYNQFHSPADSSCAVRKPMPLAVINLLGYIWTCLCSICFTKQRSLRFSYQLFVCK